ncbi:MAG TPA: HlyD family efflux transporter periplasmic adaptor subunit [Ignavibacteriales bacterium]|nr:HlyD family efflux transporter periplasmic adaptor subunit [Ignavibacteriales bacterium]
MKAKITIIFIFSLLLISCGNTNNAKIEEEGITEGKVSTISAKVQGEVKQMIKNEGEFVHSGDTIIILKNDYLQYQLQIAKANVLSAEALYELSLNGARSEDIKTIEEQVKQNEINYQQAKIDLERYKTLFSQNMISAKQMEDVRNHYLIVEAQYKTSLEQLKKIKNISRPEEIKNARANLLKAQANLDNILQNIKDCYIIAPISGYINKIFVEIGENVNPQSSLCNITNLDELKVTIYLNENELKNIKYGQNVKVTTNSGLKLNGKVIFISDQAEFTPKNILKKDEKENLVYAVKILVNNKNQDLKIGMPVNIIVE